MLIAHLCRKVEILYALESVSRGGKEMEGSGPVGEETQLLQSERGVKMGRGTDRYSERNTHTHTADGVEYSNSGEECWL